jgi:hypothetical protein
MLKLSTIAALLLSSAAVAQNPARADSSGNGREALWLSFGLGRESGSAVGLYAHAHATYSHGPFLLTAGSAGTIEDLPLAETPTDNVWSWSGMLGARTQNPAAFLTAAAGLGVGHRTHRTFMCESCPDTVTMTPTVKGLALDFGAHANLYFVGVAFNHSSLSAPRGVRFAVWSLSAEIGGFGW